MHPSMRQAAFDHSYHSVWKVVDREGVDSIVHTEVNDRQKTHDW